MSDLYYKVGDKVFYNNVETLIDFSKNPTKKLEVKLPYKFLENTELWKKNPPLSVFQYMDMHSSILRDQYNRVYIRYSGGTDSHTALESFLRSNCPVYLDHEITPEITPYSSEIYKQNKKDFQKLKNPLIKEFNLRVRTKGTSDKQFENLLSNFKYNLSVVARHNNPIYDSFTNDNLFSGMKNFNCVVCGKEKPRLIIKDGWWCWQGVDSMFTDCIWPEENMIWFFMTDEVPELQIKLTWNKILKIEELAKNQNVKITEQWVEEIQKSSSVYYEEINKSMGYQAINSFLNSSGFRWTPDNRRVREVIDHNNKMKIDSVYNEYINSVNSSIRNDFIEDNDMIYGQGVSGVLTKSIPVKPVEDIL